MTENDGVIGGTVFVSNKAQLVRVDPADKSNCCEG